MVASVIRSEPSIVRDLAARGLSLSVEGDELVIQPIELVTPDVLSRVRANKPTILAHLTAPLSAATADDPVTDTAQPRPPLDAAEDDPELWVEPEPDGLANGLATLVDELIVIERRIDQGRRFVAERAAARQPAPRTWHDRLNNLVARRASLLGLIAERVPEARMRRAALSERLDRQWVWLYGAPGDPQTETREDVWFRWFGQYEAICDALIALDQTTTGEMRAP